MDKKEIWIACDHGGYSLKEEVVLYLKENSYHFRDLGTDSTAIVRYPYYAAQVAEAVSRGKAWRGILLCSTGIGMSVVANRFSGVRASLCTSATTARLTRAHNDSNILCLGGKITGTFAALDILEQWLATEFEGGRHCISLDLIRRLDQAAGLNDPETMEELFAKDEEYPASLISPGCASETQTEQKMKDK